MKSERKVLSRQTGVVPQLVPVDGVGARALSPHKNKAMYVNPCLKMSTGNGRNKIWMEYIHVCIGTICRSEESRHHPLAWVPDPGGHSP